MHFIISVIRSLYNLSFFFEIYWYGTEPHDKIRYRTVQAPGPVTSVDTVEDRPGPP